MLERFRTSFIGKCSPVHFFWGSFDLAVTRFSGRRAPKFSGAGSVPNMPEAVVLDAYSHEVSSAGFWPGGQGIDYPAFYSYAAPSPEGFRRGEGASGASRLEPGSQPIPPALRCGSHRQRSGAGPDGVPVSTYEAAASLGKWDRAALECPLGVPDVPRKVVWD